MVYLWWKISDLNDLHLLWAPTTHLILAFEDSWILQCQIKTITYIIGSKQKSWLGGVTSKYLYSTNMTYPPLFTHFCHSLRWSDRVKLVDITRFLCFSSQTWSDHCPLFVLKMSNGVWWAVSGVGQIIFSLFLSSFTVSIKSSSLTSDTMGI